MQKGINSKPERVIMGRGLRLLEYRNLGLGNIFFVDPLPTTVKLGGWGSIPSRHKASLRQQLSEVNRTKSSGDLPDLPSFRWIISRLVFGGK